MILRRLSIAIRKQDWFTVLIETLIVVFGVFIGIQVANWNEGLAEDRREAAYLERLDTEFTAVLEDFDSVQAALDAYFNWITLFLEGVSEGDPSKAQKASWGLNAITDVEMINLEPAALREMISAGDLTIIQNPQLRSELASIPALQSRSHASLQQMAADLSPVAFEISAHFEARLEDVRDLSERAYTTETIQFDFEAISQNDALLRRINYAALQNRFQAALFASDRAEIEAVRDSVREEMKERRQ
ncbi:MAG TPA: hypothetical protein EYG02_05235 [Henriciella marina]|uniref:hypothetical protein n=1 Tax=Henriciella sp. TaxID=1968823 RepID=UPI001811965E|nr:hypothetical protein [Henriciella sp.]HIG23372.1 hypothetical protein [Henriciella sp.]HIK64415.1 hypothetical protein [Henriciella marina]